MKTNLKKYIPKQTKKNSKGFSCWKKSDENIRKLIADGYSVMVTWQEDYASALEVENYFVKYYNLK